MKCSFIPKTKDDWRLLLNIARALRLAEKKDLAFMMDVLKFKREDRAIDTIEQELQTPLGEDDA